MSSPSPHTACLPIDVLAAIAEGACNDPEAIRHAGVCPSCRAAIDEFQSNQAFLNDILPTAADHAPKPGAAEPPDPALVPDYQVVGIIGRGGQGIVYKAVHAATKRKVALKLPLHADTTSERDRLRFESEIKIVAGMRHPYIVTVYDSGLARDGRFYVAMEYIRGLRLDDWAARVDQRAKTPREALRVKVELVAKICEAVQFAHQRMIMHRDLKPGNILVDGEDQPRLLDFGIARPVMGGGGLIPTITGQFMGTPAYASPEQVAGHHDQVDVRTDVYSLGVMLFELALGYFPYPTDCPLPQLIEHIAETEPQMPAKGEGGDRVAAVDFDLRTIILKALSKDRERRYQTARDLGDDLRRWLAGDAVSARRDSTWYVLRKIARKRRGPLAAAALVLLVLVAGVIASTIGFARATTNAKRATDNATRAAANEGKAIDRAAAASAAEQAASEAEIRALKAKAEAEKQRDTAEFEAYVANLTAAQASLAANEPARARSRLDSCPQQLRNWEWRYLDATAAPNLLVLRGHESGVSFVAFSPSGDRVLTTGGDNTARVWSAQTGRELVVLRGHEKGLRSAAFDLAGTRIVTASRDNTARVWDATTGEELVALRGHQQEVMSASFSPRGNTILTASADSTARLWDASTGQELAVLRGHKDAIWFAVFSPRGDRIVTTSFDEAFLWDPETGAQLAKLIVNTPLRARPAYPSVAFSPLGDRVVTSGPRSSAHIWDAKTGKELAVLTGHSNDIQSIAFNSTGERVLTGSWDHTARVWDSSTGKEQLVLRGHDAEVLGAVFAGDGERVVTASADKTVRVWDATTGKELVVMSGHEQDVSSIVVNPSGDRVVTASSDGTARIWDVATPRDRGLLQGARNSVISAAFDPSGDRLVTACDDTTARVWDLVTGKQLAVLDHEEGPVTSASFDPTGHRIVVSAWASTAVWDATTGQAIWALRGEGLAQSAAFSPSGDRVVTASSQNTAWIRDAATGKDLAVLRGHEKAVNSAVFNRAGDRVVTGSDDKTARIWDAVSGKELAVLRGHEERLSGAVFSNSGALVITASWDGTARIWDTATGRELHVLRGDQSGLASALFNPTDDRVVTAGRGGTARVWDTSTGEMLHLLRGHENALTTAVFNAAGDRIFTASEDKTARVWDATSGKELTVLRGHSGGITSVVLSPSGDRVVTTSKDATVRVWDPVAYRERYPAIATARHAEEQLRSIIAERVEAGNTLDDLAQQAASDVSLDETHRRASLILITEERERRESQMIAQMREASSLNSAAWKIVRRTDATHEEIDKALDQVRRAVLLDPKDWAITNTLRIALYRAGRYEESLTMRVLEPHHPADWAFIAMARFKLGQTEEAREAFAHLRELMKRVDRSKDDELLGFVHEAEQLIEGVVTEPQSAPTGK